MSNNRHPMDDVNVCAGWGWPENGILCNGFWGNIFFLGIITKNGTDKPSAPPSQVQKQQRSGRGPIGLSYLHTSGFELVSFGSYFKKNLTLFLKNI